MALFAPVIATPDDDEWPGLVKDLGLRWYQEEADAAIAAALEEVRAALLVMATGLGKTQTFGARIAATKGRVLVLAHRDELIDQARRRIEQMTGEWVEVEQNIFKASGSARVIVASVQSMQRKRLKRFPPDFFELIVIDECHHATAPSYRTILDYFAAAKILGVTATPDRGDGTALGKVFDRVAYQFDIEDGINEGYLVPVRGQRVHLDSIDISHVKSGQAEGGLNLAQLDEAMVKAVEGIVQKTLELEPNRQGVCFFPGVRSAEYAMEKFNTLKPGSAIVLSGNTDPEERRRLIRGFKAGDHQYLCNCMIATEGFDAPTADLIVMGRPTKSRALYAQMIGRGTRVLPGIVEQIPGREFAHLRRERIARSKKPDMMVLDFVGNSGRHSLASIEDVLGGKYSDEEVARAKKKTPKGGDALDALRQARRELAAIAAKAKAKVSARAEFFDPFAKLMGIDTSLDDKYIQKYGSKPKHGWQKDRLIKLGYTEAECAKMDRRAADKLIQEAERRYRAKLASYKQLKILARYGAARPDLSFERASAAMNYLHKRGFRNVDPKGLEAILNHQRQPGED